MKKDIFIDNNIASRHLSNPINESYKNLIRWLLTYQEQEETDAYLVVSPFLRREYEESNRNASSKSNIVNLIIELQKQDRLIHFDKKSIERFQKEYFIKKILKKLQSNAKDRNHLPIVLMSDRKMALSEDAKFLEDLQQFTEFNPVVARNPDDLDYENL